MSGRIGVLLLDSIDPDKRSIAGDYDRLFADLLWRPGIEIAFFDGRIDELPDHGECDGWIIPGSRQSVYDDLPWIEAMTTWTTEALDLRTPLAGICFGHQLIGQVLGSAVSKADVGWNIGAIDYEIHNQPPQLPNVPERFRIIASHQDQLDHLPDGATLFASSERCPIAGYTVDNHVMCVQAHPEWVPDLASALYRSRVERIGENAVEAAITTLDQPLDRQLVADWLLATVSRQQQPSSF